MGVVLFVRYSLPVVSLLLEFVPFQGFLLKLKLDLAVHLSIISDFVHESQ